MNCTPQGVQPQGTRKRKNNLNPKQVERMK